MDLEDKQSCFETFHILTTTNHSQSSVTRVILTYDQGRLHLEV